LGFEIQPAERRSTARWQLTHLAGLVMAEIAKERRRQPPLCCEQVQATSPWIPAGRLHLARRLTVSRAGRPLESCHFPLEMVRAALSCSWMAWVEPPCQNSVVRRPLVQGRVRAPP